MSRARFATTSSNNVKAKYRHNVVGNQWRLTVLYIICMSIITYTTMYNNILCIYNERRILEIFFI